MAQPRIFAGSAGTSVPALRHGRAAPDPQKMRDILTHWGYNVRSSGPLTARLVNAWHHFRAGTRQAVGASHDNYAVAKMWNRTPLGSRLDHSSKAGPVSGAGMHHGGAYTGPAGGEATWRRANHPGTTAGKRPKGDIRPDPVVNAHNQARTHAKAAAHASSLGAGRSGAKLGGSGIPGVKEAGPNVNKIIPDSYAEAQAGMQYDPQIHQALADRAQGKADIAQSQADISGWYRQVQTSLAQAAAQDAAAGGQTQAQVNNDIQGILQSLGGSRGAGVVGGVGTAALASIAKQAQGQNALDAQLAPIFQAESAAANMRQAAVGAQNEAKASQAIEGLQGARGQAKSAAMQAIIQANNAVRQQNFANRLSVQNAGLAAQSLGLNVANTRSTIAARNAQTAYSYASLKERQAEFKAQQAGSKAALRAKSGGGGWKSLPGQSKIAAIQSALQFAVPQHTHGGQTDWKAVQNTSLAYLRGAGFHSARKLSYPGQVPDTQARNDINNLLNLQIKAHQGGS